MRCGRTNAPCDVSAMFYGCKCPVCCIYREGFTQGVAYVIKEVDMDEVEAFIASLGDHDNGH